MGDNQIGGLGAADGFWDTWHDRTNVGSEAEFPDTARGHWALSASSPSEPWIQKAQYTDDPSMIPRVANKAVLRVYQQRYRTPDIQIRRQW